MGRRLHRSKRHFLFLLPFSDGLYGFLSRLCDNSFYGLIIFFWHIRSVQVESIWHQSGRHFQTRLALTARLAGDQNTSWSLA